MKQTPLSQDKDAWKLTRALTEKDIPSTVQGVISARLDRLERETKRILQEASVIGRAFLYEILQRISDLKEYIDKSLMNLERLDLIKTRSLQPELEYIFKHALTQEVVYNGLLMKERRLIHEKIGLVMEELFQDHLPEFYEILAYHYSQSDNFPKAYEYLKLSGGKAAKNYASQEAIRFYKEALRMLDTQSESLRNKKEKLKVSLKIIIPLAFLTYPDGSLEIFQNGEKLAQELGDEKGLVKMQVALGMYYSFTGNPSLSLKTVNEMTGDGVMALFGAPIALEDAPQRAIRSALAIHQEIARFSDRMKQENKYPADQNADRDSYWSRGCRHIGQRFESGVQSGRKYSQPCLPDSEPCRSTYYICFRGYV